MTTDLKSMTVENIFITAKSADYAVADAAVDELARRLEEAQQETKKLEQERQLSREELETRYTMIDDWHLKDKGILADALKEIYAIRGEDHEIAAIVLAALHSGNVPGY